jgi:hypothetical protein
LLYLARLNTKTMSIFFSSSCFVVWKFGRVSSPPLKSSVCFVDICGRN